MVRDGCSEALPGSDVNGTNMQGCHDQSGGDQIDNHNHNLNHNHNFNHNQNDSDVKNCIAIFLIMIIV